MLAKLDDKICSKSPFVMTANCLSTITTRLTGSSTSSISSKKWDNLPTFDELPKFHEFSGCAWDLWGEGDELGTINLLTEDVVREAAKEVKIGRTVSLNWPLNFPEKPLFGRRPPHIEVIKPSPEATWFDDEMTINTQSGSQWDSLRHFGVVKYGVFYQNTPREFFRLGKIPNEDPMNIDRDLIKFGIHNLAQHGISGRGVFLDLVKFYTQDGRRPLPYDPWTAHPISVTDLEACAKSEGIQFKQGDILLIRVGFTKRYNESSSVEKDELPKKDTFVGIEQSEDMKCFLWNNHFSAVASDATSLECVPPVDEDFLHQTIIGLFGMPIGELFDLEKLAEVCAATGRYTFFFTSWPLNILGGCASPPNAATVFCLLAIQNSFNMAVDRLSTIASHVTGSFASSKPSKKWNTLPDFDELPRFHEFAGCAWDLWGAGDELGTINLLTEDTVHEAAKEVKTGQSVCLNWPLNFPEKPLFSRLPPHIEVIKPTPDATWFDDEITINSQSGSQWDGLRHFGVIKHGVFYQNTPKEEFSLGKIPNADPLNVDQNLIKFGMHNWAQHGICGRGVFLDLVKFYTQDGLSSLPYDPWTSHSIGVVDLETCAKAEGVQFKRGDILIIRVGFTKRYNESSQREKDELRERESTFVGIEQSEDMKRFLWNNHFAAVASDAAALERMPPVEGKYMHQTIIGLFGMPIGELFDLEKLSEVCAATGRYTFFFTSWPLNILGGCASPPNAAFDLQNSDKSDRGTRHNILRALVNSKLAVSGLR
ncbi:hypothetical protein ACEPAH_5166 [Sanghuangporus vaninii]